MASLGPNELINLLDKLNLNINVDRTNWKNNVFLIPYKNTRISIHILYITHWDLSIEISSSQYKESHCGNETVVKWCNHHNGIFISGKNETRKTSYLLNTKSRQDTFMPFLLTKLFVSPPLTNLIPAPLPYPRGIYALLSTVFREAYMRRVVDMS